MKPCALTCHRMVLKNWGSNLMGLIIRDYPSDWWKMKLSYWIKTDSCNVRVAQHKYESWHFIYYSAKVIDIFVKGSIMNWKVVCTRIDVNDTRYLIEKMNLNGSVEAEYYYTGTRYSQKTVPLMKSDPQIQDVKPKYEY